MMAAPLIATARVHNALSLGPLTVPQLRRLLTRSDRCIRVALAELHSVGAVSRRRGVANHQPGHPADLWQLPQGGDA